jgi:hypothetical protein
MVQEMRLESLLWLWQYFEMKGNLKMLRETRWNIGVQNVPLSLSSKLEFSQISQRKTRDGISTINMYLVRKQNKENNYKENIFLGGDKVI